MTARRHGRTELTPWARDALAAAGVDVARLRERIPTGTLLSGHARTARGPWTYALRWTDGSRRPVLFIASTVDVIADALDQLLGDDDCCACRWFRYGEDCGHPASDGITSPHTHCSIHDYALRTAPKLGEPTQ